MSKNPVAGRFKSTGGDNFIEFLDRHGNIMHSVASDGTIFAKNIVYSDGSSQSSANAPATPSTPSSDGIDVGTF